MSQDIKRRLCKFTTAWCLFKEFSSWLLPVKYQSQKAYCLLCKRAFSVSHSGLHDVKAHWKGKKHLQLQEQENEKNIGERLNRREIKAYSLVFNEELNSTEECNGYYESDPFEQHSSLRSPDLRMIASLVDDGHILTPTVTLDSEPESPPVSMSIADRDMSLQIKSQVTAQQYCLRWKYHHSNLQVMFIQLLQRESFCDVTLACEGKMLRAHKVVLSACSTYFDKIFSEHEEKDPVVILKDVKFVDIKALVEFMYKGEINVENSHLTSLLKTAEELKIKGLADVSGKSLAKDEDDSISYQPSNTIHAPHTGHTSHTGHMSHMSHMSQVPVSRDKDEHMADYEDMFTSTMADGAPSVHDVSDNDDSMAKRDDADDHGDYMESGNEQNFSTLIAHLSQDYQSEDNPSMRMSDHHETSLNHMNTNPEPQSLASQFSDVIKMNDYLTTGRRQQFWEEPFTRRLMEAIKNKEIEMKAAAELMGVSYGTLYGRYRDAYGCLKHPYRTKDFWAEQGPADILAKLQRKEITLFRAAEMLNVTVTTLANYLSTLRYEKDKTEKESDNEDEDEEMDINDTMEVFLNDPMPAGGKMVLTRAPEQEDEDSRSSSNAVERSDEDFP